MPVVITAAAAGRAAPPTLGEVVPRPACLASTVQLVTSGIRARLGAGSLAADTVKSCLTRADTMVLLAPCLLAVLGAGLPALETIVTLHASVTVSRGSVTRCSASGCADRLTALTHKAVLADSADTPEAHLAVGTTS